MGLGKMMDFTLIMFIVTITLVLIFPPLSAYSETFVNLTDILSSPNAPLLYFLKLLQKENVIEILQTQAHNQTGLTLFAPNDAAISSSNISWETLSAAQFESLLLFHALPQYFSDTSSDINTLCQLSPVTTMAGGQYTLNITFVSETLYTDSGWTCAQVLTAVNLTTYPTQVYQIDKVLMPEAIFSIPTPPTPAPAPSASTTSTPYYNESGNYPPLKSGTGGLSGGAIAVISIGGVMGALLVAVCIKWGFYRKKKMPDEFSISKRAEEQRLQSGSAPRSASEKSNSTGTPGTSRCSSINKVVKFSYEELAKATNEFSGDRKIGRGGFGAVYYAELQGEKAAIKKMDMTAKREFRAELEVLAQVHHRHLVRLIGYCVEGCSLFLVYEYIDNGNLGQHLHGTGRDPLPWTTRMQIALDSATALEYIHEHTEQVHIHRDIKSANILIDNSLHAKIAEFGLTKLAELRGSTNLKGTYGHIAPESFQCRDISPKVDVYAFGVVLYELISAKQAITAEPRGLDSLFEEALNKPDPREDLCKLIDPRLGDKYPLETVLEMARLAKQCIQADHEQRPCMSAVVRELRTLSPLTEASDFGSYYENQALGSPSPLDSLKYSDPTFGQHWRANLTN